MPKKFNQRFNNKNMKTKIPLKLLVAALLLLPLLNFAQRTAINEDNFDAHPSAMLDI